MALITRQGKGSALTIEELDGNLEYLETLGVADVYQQSNKVLLERLDSTTSEITINNNLPVVVKKIIGDGEFVTYKGILEYSFEEPTFTIPLKYNTDKDTLLDIIPEWGKTYYLSGTVLVRIENSYNVTTINGYLESNKNYNPDIPFYVDAYDVGIIEIQDDGKLVLGGYLSLNGGSSINIARLNANGEIDTTFNTGVDSFNNQTIAIKIQSDGKLLVGGKFTTYNEASVNRIVRLNSDGSIDNTFDIGTGIVGSGNNNDGVYSITIQSDGKLLIGGQFTSYNETSSNHIIRLNSDGSIDDTFNIGTGFNNSVRTIKIQPDGKLLVGGWFTSYNETTSNRIIRLNSDGSIDNTFDIGTGFNDNVRIIQTLTDGKILVGGSFTTYNGSSYNRLIKLNSDGSIDNTFNIGTGFDYNVRVIQIQSDGKLLIGGGFESYNDDDTKKYFLRLNSDGSLDTTFNIVADDVGDNYVQAITINSDGNILVGGWAGLFRFSFDGISTKGFPKFNSYAGSLTTLNNKLYIIIDSGATATDNGILQFEIVETAFIK
jgi:uncharacterized delta-60 repeat protein